MKDRIALGVYPAGKPLPSLKQLSHDPGGNFRTVRKAIQVLCTEGICVRKGRSYVVAGEKKPHSELQVLLVRAARYPRMPHTSLRTMQLFQILQDMAWQRNLSLHEIHFNPVDNRLFEYSTNSSLNLKEMQRNLLAGTILWTSGFTQEALDILLSKIRQLQQPVLLVDENGRFSRRLSLGRSPVAVLRLGNTLNEGSQVARFLHAKGHTAVACVFPENSEGLPLLRFDGLRETLTDRAPDAQVSFHYELTPATGKRSSFRVKARGTAKSLELVIDNAFDTAKASLDALAQRLGSALVENLYTAALDVLNRELIEHLCLQILDNTAITAIVAHSDSVAFIVLQFLRNRNVNIPADIAVIGFDDSEPAYIGNITSYHYNLTEAAHEIIHFFLTASTSRFDRRRYASPIEVTGHIIQRSTT